MFRPYDQPPSHPPSRPDYAVAPPQRFEASAAPVKVHAPLPSNWDQLDLDQRVRSIGEW